MDGKSSGGGGQCGRQLFQLILPKISIPPVNSLALCRLAICTDALKRNMRQVMAALLCDQINVSMEEVIIFFNFGLF
jgi:hypothetical protein